LFDFKIEKKYFVEIYYIIQQVLGDEAASCITTYIWWKRFKDDQESLDEDKQCGRPSTVVHDENVIVCTRTLSCKSPTARIRDTPVGFTECLLYYIISFYKRCFR